MEETLHRVAMLFKEARELEAKLDENKAALKEATDALVSHVDASKKTHELPVGYGTLVLYARDYKLYTGDSAIELERLDIVRKAAIAPIDKRFKSDKANVERLAEAAGEVNTDRRWYVKGG